MKILVCTDGSKQSLKAVEKAADLAAGCSPSDVAVLHVYDDKQEVSPLFVTSNRQADLIKKMKEEHRAEKEKILADAVNILAAQNINARTILKEGHPSHTIVKVAAEEGFDTIVIGSRGLGGLSKVILGSVSNAVAQEAHNCAVVLVK